MAELMLCFESVGHGCEFGVVQRCLGADPLGLFRFASADIANLITVLANDLDDFLTPDDLGIVVRGQEFMVFSRRYDDFYAHTHAIIDEHDEADVLARETKKAAYLKRRFVSDWAEAERIYVHCGTTDEAAIRRLHAILRMRSDCVLLWVVQAPKPEYRGHVEVCTEGLLKGYLGHLGTFDWGPRLDLPAWARICRSAHAIVHGLPVPPSPALDSMTAEFVWSRGAVGHLFMSSAGAVCRVLHQPVHPTPVVEVAIAAKFPAKSTTVFSVWLRLPATFEGSNVMLHSDGGIIVNHHRADLAIRDRWQHLWLIVRTLETKKLLRVTVNVQAQRGSMFHLAGWQIEAGCVPHENLWPYNVFPAISPPAAPLPSRPQPDRLACERGGPPSADSPSMADLILRFEAIGIDCQFGAVQRCCGTEPLGLLRFTASSIPNLVALLDSDLAGFRTPDDIELEVKGGEYMISSRRYKDFSAHTNALSKDQDATTVIARESKKAAYLKKRFRLDWENAEKIFVHCGCESEIEILNLHAALRRRSDCWLLWAVVATRFEDRGRVALLRPGFMKGFLADHGGFGDGGFHADLPGWAMICRAADAIRRGVHEAPMPARDPIGARYAWASARCGAVECGDTVGRCRLVHDCQHSSGVAEVTIGAVLEAKRLVVFSLWVRLSPSFTGRKVMLTSDAGVPVNFRTAQLATLDVWQQIWIVMKIAKPCRAMTVRLEVEAARGSEILFSGWRLEDGAIADEGLRPSVETRSPDSGAEPMPFLEPGAPRTLKTRIAARLRRAAGRLAPEPAASTTEDSVVFDFLRLSNILMDKRRFDEADAVLLAARNLFPWRAELYSHYGLSAQLRTDLQMAAARWVDAIENFPQYAYPRYSLAGVLRELNETQRALAVVEAALPRHLDDSGMVSEAARVYATAHRWSDALAAWDRAFALSGERPEWRDARAHAAEMAARFPPLEGSAIKA